MHYSDIQAHHHHVIYGDNLLHYAPFSGDSFEAYPEEDPGAFKNLIGDEGMANLNMD